jgi:trypsin
VILIGWGAEKMGGNTYDELKQAQVKVISQCDRYWSQFDEDNQICVGHSISGDSACQGDSGGPLLQQSNGQWVVQGVASFVDDCKTNGNFPPNVYVKVSAYLPWIDTIIT